MNNNGDGSLLIFHFFHSISINKKDINARFFKFDIWSSFLFTYGLNPMHLILCILTQTNKPLKIVICLFEGGV